jgi:hypothetical protein
MGFFTVLIVGFIMAGAALALSELLRPKPPQERLRPAGLGDFQFPTAEEGRPVPTIWGTVKTKGPNVLWYGDLRQKPIKQTVKTGLFSSDEIIKGYRYFVGIQFGLCRGQIDAVKRVWIGDTEVASGSVQDGTFEIDKPRLFGGNDFGNGGVSGTMRIISGTESQTANTYLSSFQSPTPAYRGTSQAVWEGGYFGNSTSIKPVAFEVARFPNQLGLTGGKEIVNSNDANPAAVLYEILTDDDWGFGFPALDIDVSNFQTAGDTLYTEGNGFSFILDNFREATDVLNELQRQIDGIVYLDQSTGKFKINLARGGYDIDTVPQIDSTNIVEVRNFTRGTWEQTSNQVRINFSDRVLDYKNTFAQDHDLANQLIQAGELITVTESFPGVKDKTLAKNIAARQIKTLALPLAQASIVVDRSLWELVPGDVVAWTDSVLGFTKLAMRVKRIDFGDLINGRIELELTEDVFEFATGSFGDPDDTRWTAPTQSVAAIPAAEQTIFEAPYAFTRRDQTLPGVIDRIWAGGRAQTGSEVSLRLYQRNHPTTPAGSYTLSGEIFDFLFIGELRTAVSAGAANPGTVSVDPDPDALADIRDAFTASPAKTDIGQNLVNLIKIGDEFMAVTSVTDQTTYVDLNSTYRGLLDTVPADHAINDPVFLVFVAGGLSFDTIPQTNVVDVQLRGTSRTDEVTEGAATTVQIQMANRARRPYPPAELLLNGTRFDDPVDYDDLKAGGSTLDDRGVEVDFNRKDFRNLDEVQSTENDAADIISDFPAANTHQSRVELLGGSMATGLISAWRLEEASGTRSDNVGTADLTDNNGVTQTTGPANLGNAARFTRADTEYLSSADASLDMGDETFTIAMWVRLRTGTLNLNQGGMGKWHSTGSNLREYGLFYVGGGTQRWRMGVQDSGGTTAVISAPSAPTAEQWHLVIGWHDPVANLVYIQFDNGTVQSIAHSTGVNTLTAQDFEIGRTNLNTIDQHLDGDVAFAAVWDRLLTEEERALLWNAGAGQQDPFEEGLLLAFDWADQNSVHFSRTKILEQTGGEKPTGLEVLVKSRHTFEETVYEAIQNLDWPFDLDTSTLDNDDNLGNLDDSEISPVYTAPDTGTYTFNIGTALSTGDVEARINGGSWTQVIAATNSTGTLVGVTASDTIEVQHLQTGGGTNSTFLEVVPPTSTAGAYAILVY